MIVFLAVVVGFIVIALFCLMRDHHNPLADLVVLFLKPVAHPAGFLLELELQEAAPLAFLFTSCLRSQAYEPKEVEQHWYANWLKRVLQS